MPNRRNNHPDKRPNREPTIEQRIPAAILRLLTTSPSTLHLQIAPSNISSTTRGESWFLAVDSADGLRHMATLATIEGSTSIFKVVWWREGTFGSMGSYQADYHQPTRSYATVSGVTNAPLGQFEQEQWQRSGGIDRIVVVDEVIFTQKKSHTSNIDLVRLAGDLEQGIVNVDAIQTAQDYFNKYWGEATPGQPPLMLQ